MGRASLSFEVLSSLLTEVEVTINSRPLTFIYNEPEEPQPLTQAHFLIGKWLYSLAPKPFHAASQTSNSSWEGGPKDGNFWTFWKKEYLLELRSSHTRSIPQWRVSHWRQQDATPGLENRNDQGTVPGKRRTCEILCRAHTREDNIKKSSSTLISFRDLNMNYLHGSKNNRKENKKMVVTRKNTSIYLLPKSWSENQIEQPDVEAQCVKVHRCGSDTQYEHRPAYKDQLTCCFYITIENKVTASL